MSKFKRALSVFLCLAMIFTFCSVAVSADEETPETGDIFRVSCCVNGDTKTQRGFCWYTKESCETKISVFEGETDVTDTLTLADVVSEEWEGYFMHKVLVKGLKADTAYTYRLYGPENAYADGTFKTDNDDDKVEFIGIADVQAGNLGNFLKGARTAQAAIDTMPNADFMVTLGDYTDDSTNEEWDYNSIAFNEINRSITQVPVAGNHDGLGVWNWFNNMFCVDTSESVQTLNGMNYSFDYGNVHFAVVNTNDFMAVSVPQLIWLKKDLMSTDADWKVVFMHKSPYSLGKDIKWPDASYLQEALVSVLDDCNVDLVMSGHDHQYLRTNPLKNNKVNDDGTVYVLAGTAGNKRYEIREFILGHFLKENMIGAMTVQKDGYGNYWDGTSFDNTKETNIGGCFNTISVDGGKLTYTAYIIKDKTNPDDATEEDVITVIDEFTIEKETGENEIEYTGDKTTTPFGYIMGLIPSALGLGSYAILNWLPRFFIMLPKLVYVYITQDVF